MGIKNGGINIADAVKGGDILADKLDKPIKKMDEFIDTADKLDKKQVSINPKVDASELKKLNGIKDIEVFVTPTISKNAEKTISDGIKKIISGVNKEFSQKPPKATWKAMKKYVPELSNVDNVEVGKQITRYESKLGRTLSDNERSQMTEQYSKIRQLHNAIKQLESDLSQRTGAFTSITSMNPSAIKAQRESAQLLFKLKETLNDINQPGQSRWGGTVLEAQNPQKAKSQYDQIRSDLIQSIYEGSGVKKYIDSVNSGKDFSSDKFDKLLKPIEQGIQLITDSYKQETKKAVKKTKNEASAYNNALKKMSEFRSVSKDQSQRYLEKLSNEILGVKDKNVKDSISDGTYLTAARAKNFIGNYFAYKSNGGDPSSINTIFDEWIKVYSNEIENNEFLPFYKAINDVFSTDNTEMQAPKVDTKPLQKEAKEIKESNEVIRDETKKTDKVIEDSNKKQKKVDNSKENPQQNQIVQGGSTYDKLQSQSFVTKNKAEAKRQLENAYNQMLKYQGEGFRGESYTYLGTIAADQYLKAYGEALSKKVSNLQKYEKFENDNFNSYLLSKKQDGIYGWKYELYEVQKRLQLFSSIYDSISGIDKKLLKGLNAEPVTEFINSIVTDAIKLNDIISDDLYNGLMGGYTQIGLSNMLHDAITNQNILNGFIETKTGVKNAIDVIPKIDIDKLFDPSRDAFDSKFDLLDFEQQQSQQQEVKQKQQEAQKIVESNNDIATSEEKVAEIEKKTTEQRSDKKSVVKAKQEEAKAIVEANNQEAESEKKLAETEKKVAKQKKKTETADSKKKKQEEKPVSTTPSIPDTPISAKETTTPILTPPVSPTSPIQTPKTTELPQINTEESKKQLEDESKAFEKVENAAEKAATAKENFNSANQMVAAGAEKSSKAIEKELEEMQAISEDDVLDALGNVDKLTIVENGSGDVTSYTGVTTQKTDNSYETTTKKYKSNEDGNFELAYTSTVEDMKRLKTEAEKESVKVQKANEKLDKFIANIDLQMGGKINAMQLDGYMGLKHISSADEIDGIVKAMERVEAEKKKIFASSKTNQKDLFGVNNLQSTVSSVVSAFNALNDPSDELSESVGRMLDLNEELKDASGIYEQAEAAGKLRDSISECNTQIKQQQNLEKDAKRISDSNKKNALLDEKKKNKEQELNDLEKRLKDSFKYSDQVASQIESLRNILSSAYTNIDLSIFDTKFKSLKKSENSLPIVTESFKSNWDSYLEIIDKNNESIIKEKAKQDKDNFIKNLQNITAKTPDLPTENNSFFLDDIKKETTDAVKQVISLQDELTSIYNSVSAELRKDESSRDKNFIYEQKTFALKKEYLKKQLENSDVFKNRAEFIDQDLEYDYINSTNKFNKANKSVNTQEALNKQNTQTKQIVDQYDKALAKVKELEKAQNELFSIQKAQSDNPYNDMSQDIDDAKNKVASLKTETEQLFTSQDIKNRTILGDKKVDDLQDYYDKVNKNSENNRKLENLMVDAYKSYRNAEKNVFKNIGSKDSNSLSSEIERMKVFEKEYNRLKTEISSTKGADYQNPEIANLEKSFDVKNTELLKKNISSISNAIEDFKSKFGNKDGAASIMANDFIKPYEDAFNKVKDKISEGKKLTSEDFDDIFNVKKAIEEGPGSLSDGFMRKYNEAYKLLDKLGSYTNIKGKSSSYGSILQSFTKEINDLVNDKNMPDEDKIKKIIDIYDRLYDFSKNSKAFDLNNSKGRLVEGTESYMKSAEDVVNYLRDYAQGMNLGKEISSTISDTGQVTMQFQNQSGAVTTLKGSIEQYTQALRMMNSEQTKTGSSFSTFTGALKSIAGGSIKDVLKMVTSYVSSYRIMSTMLSQLKEGFTTLKGYDDNLTTISYTMDITKSQLESLGQSAIDMAQDLSMSLDNAMDIYQIYANMNTTAQEINETAKPTAILSNLSGVDTSTAADQVQGILQQFHMLEDGSQSAADASMHVVDVLDNISSNVAIDYAKGIKVISDAVQASGQVAYDAGMSYEQLAAVSAKVAERTREDGGSIGNAIKTIITRISKVGKMPQYASDVSNEELSNASKSLHEVGVEVYNVDGSFRDLDVILSELSAKWDSLSDAQQSNISYNIAATRQSSKFKNILTAWTDAMSLATDATNSQGNALENQAKYEESFTGKVTKIKAQMDEFWLSFYDSAGTKNILDFVINLTEAFTDLAQTIGPVKTLLGTIFGLSLGKNGLSTMMKLFTKSGGLKNAVAQLNPGCYSRYNFMGLLL